VDHSPPAKLRNGRFRFDAKDAELDFGRQPDQNDPEKKTAEPTSSATEAVERPDIARDRKRETLIPDPAATTAKDVWLTFDDGPNPESTPKVLAALSRANLKATFFMLGLNAEAQPRLVERVFDAGHRIGNHSYSHPHLTELTEAEIREEIGRTDRLLAPYLGADKLFRPPYGHTNSLVQMVAAELGYREVRWTVDPRDWDKSYRPKKWMNFGISQMKALSSCVVLLHDIRPATSSNVAAFIAMIRQLAGARFKAPSTL